MKFDNKLKGAITQALLKSLLENAQYVAVPMGVEETVREIKEMGEAEYLEFGFPHTLRTTPDFLVLDRVSKRSWLIEVKFRHAWNIATRDELKSTLEKQVENWGKTYLMLFLGSSAYTKSLKSCASQSVRMVALTTSSGKLMVDREKNPDPDAGERRPRLIPWNEADWHEDFLPIQNVLHRLRTTNEQDTLVKCRKIAECLAEKLGD